MVKVDTKRDDLLADYAVGMLKDFYMRKSEKSPQEAYARAATAWSRFNNKEDNDFISKYCLKKKNEIVKKKNVFFICKSQ